MNAPERIWAKGNTIDYDLTRWSISRWNGDTEYIRSDLVPQWQPIETAPRDGTPILLCLYNAGFSRVFLAFWDKFRDVDNLPYKVCGWNLTHPLVAGALHGKTTEDVSLLILEDKQTTPCWMPIPEPPYPTARHST